jgi:FmdE, Molybdenum formylmethanofuran dehydrogenase operon
LKQPSRMAPNWSQCMIQFARMHKLRASFEASLRCAPQDEEICAGTEVPYPEVRAKYEPRRTHIIGAALFLLSVVSPAFAHPGHSPTEDRSAENRDYWIERGAQVHGGFGSLIALGVRIGEDAMKQLLAERRELDVTYFNGSNAPCPCVIDGIGIVTMASLGQGTLRMAVEPAAEGLFGRVLFRHRKTGGAVEYTIPDSAVPLMQTANTQPPDKRWDMVMDAMESTLFSKRRIKASN